MMTPITFDAPQVQALQPEAAIAYVKQKGWQPVPHPNHNIELFQGKADDSGQPIQLVLPKHSELWDSSILLAKAINLLAAIEEKSPLEILTAMQSGSAEDSEENIMQTLDRDKQVLLERISQTVEALMQRDSLYREYSLDKDEIIRTMFKMFSENFSFEELKAKPDIYFTEVVEAHMMAELLLAGEENISDEFDLKHPVLDRISKIVEQLIQSNPLSQHQLNQEKIMETLSSLLDKVSPEKLLVLDDEQLTKRVKAVMSTELMAHLLYDLKSEEVEKFNAAVEWSR